jgi:regulator of sigma E protease
MLTLLAFLAAIALLVVWHELGHYLAARLCGVKVLRFSVGFGRPLLVWVSKKTGTEWVLAGIPLGGYVSMLDEREAEQPIPADLLPQAFNRQTLSKRAFIVVAGPLANFLLAFVLYWTLAVTGTQEPAAIVDRAPPDTLFAKAGFVEPMRVVAIEDEPVRSINDASWRLTEAALARSIVEVRVTGWQGGQADRGSTLRVDFSGLSKSDLDGNFLAKLGWRLSAQQPRVGEVMRDGPAARAGLQAGDVVLAAGSVQAPSVQQLVELIQRSQGVALPLKIQREGASIEIVVVPVKSDRDLAAKIGIGFAPTERVYVQYGPFDAISVAAGKTWDITTLTLKMLGQIVTGQASISNLSGPLTIADAAGKTASIGLAAYISFLALVSVGLGVLNLLPVPMLDGGHLLYYAAEGVLGRPLPNVALAWGQRIGILLLGALMAIALTNDVVRLLS